MKILTKEEEQAHYKYAPFQAHSPSERHSADDCSETLKGGFLGGSIGLALGVGGVYVAAARYPAFRQLTLPLRAFLCTSGATFGGTWASFHARLSTLQTILGRSNNIYTLPCPSAKGVSGPPSDPPFLESSSPRMVYTLTNMIDAQQQS